MTSLNRPQKASQNTTLSLLSDLRVPKNNSQTLSLGRELHDRLGPSLAAVRIKLDHILTKPSIHQSDLDALAYQLDAAQLEYRRLLEVVNESQSLISAGMEETISGAKKLIDPSIEFICEVETDHSLIESVETQLALIAQEAVINAQRHSAATRIRLTWQNFDGKAILEVIDNGHGFSDSQPRSDCYGISGMYERSQLIGAEFNINSNNKGTLVQCLID